MALDFQIREYELAWNELLRVACHSVAAQDELVSAMVGRRSEITEHRGPNRNVRGPVTLDTPFSELQYGASISTDALRNGSVDDHTEFLYQMGLSLKSQLAPQIVATMSQVVSATGNDDYKGKPFDWDVYNDALEMVELSFDENEDPVPPTLFVGTELAKRIAETEPTPEQELRRSEILKRKKAEHIATKRTRRLL